MTMINCFKVRDVVRHGKYGDGVVINVEFGCPAIEVYFPLFGNYVVGEKDLQKLNLEALIGMEEFYRTIKICECKKCHKNFEAVVWVDKVYNHTVAFENVTICKECLFSSNDLLKMGGDTYETTVFK